MSSFLTEELSEIESIYDSIRARLIDICELSELKELVRAIETEINERIRELKWIKLKSALIHPQRNKELYKRFYAMTLRGLYTIKYRTIILSRLTNVITLYVYLKDNTKYNESTTALKKFIDDVKIRLEDIKNLRLYTFIEYAYSMITILDKCGIVAFCTPSYDMLKPWKWILLLHELELIMFNMSI